MKFLSELTERIPGGAENVKSAYRLTNLQRDMLFHHLYEADGKSDTYNLPLLIRFDTEAALGDFCNALNALIARHDILRTSFAWLGLDHPIQIVWNRAELHVQPLTAEPSQTISDIVREYSNERFRLDFSQAPILQARSIHLDNKWWLLLVSHHVIEDFRSIELASQEMARFLEGYADLGDPPQFSTVLNRFDAQSHSSRARDHEWLAGKLRGYVRPDAGNSSTFAYTDCTQAREHLATLPREFYEAVADLCQERRVTSAAVFHLAWAATLAEAEGTADVLFGSVRSLRAVFPEMATCLGPLIDTVPIRVDFRRGTIADLLEDVHLALGQSLQLGEVSLSDLKRLTDVPPHRPLFNGILNFRRAGSPDDPTERGSRLRVPFISSERYSFPYAFAVSDSGVSYLLTIQTTAQELSPARLFERVLEKLQAVLDPRGMHTSAMALINLEACCAMLHPSEALTDRKKADAIQVDRSLHPELLKACQEILGRTLVASQRSFLEQGGTSVEALRLSAMLGRTADGSSKISVRDVLNSPTLGQLSDLLNPHIRH